MSPEIGYWQRVAILDTDFLINILDRAEEKVTIKAFEKLALMFHRIFIPQKVKEEFLRGGMRGSTAAERKLKNLLNLFAKIQPCPVRTNKRERNSLHNEATCSLEEGEADAIKQALKLLNYENVREVTLLTQDGCAIEVSSNRSLEVLQYREFKRLLRETGIVLP